MTAISGSPGKANSAKPDRTGIQELAKLLRSRLGGEAQQFEPMIANDAQIDGARANEGELGRHGHAGQYIESLSFRSRLRDARDRRGDD